MFPNPILISHIDISYPVVYLFTVAKNLNSNQNLFIYILPILGKLLKCYKEHCCMKEPDFGLIFRPVN